MSQERGSHEHDKQADAEPRGFTNDGKVSSEIVNDSYGTVDPADSTGLDDDAETRRKANTAPAGAAVKPGDGHAHKR